jgi:hypothetical protein
VHVDEAVRSTFMSSALFGVVMHAVGGTYCSCPPEHE